jgi:hypothetical protein
MLLLGNFVPAANRLASYPHCEPIAAEAATRSQCCVLPSKADSVSLSRCVSLALAEPPYSVSLSPMRELGACLTMQASTGATATRRTEYYNQNT